jgi:Mg-chelatase subunit ChlD
MPDPRAVTEALATAGRPHLIGVRHHSPTLAAAMPALLAAARPDVLLLELPADVQGWVEWLAHPEAQAPLALAVTATGGAEELPGFYPFADFSPELAAVRYCAANGIPVRAIDLPAGAAPLPEPAADTPDTPDGAEDPDAAGDADEPDGGPSWVAAVCARLGVDDPGALWDALVEARAPGSTPEALRRAALLAGWLLRLDAPALRARDARREAYMRAGLAAALAEGFTRPVAVIGSFHAAALLDADSCDPFAAERWRAPEPPPGPVTASLLPYAFELFDDRSGYPAGIRDPRWRQRLFEVLGDPGATSDAARADAAGDLVDEVLVDVARHVRRARHVAGLPDAREAARAARDLSRLRGLPAPGRTELLEALMLALGQGEPLGRGRVLARALETVMVGRTRGRLAPATPRAGLLPHVEALLAALRLPGPESAGREAEPVRLDPLRSPLDRRRHVALMRLAACHVPYAERRESGYETLTHVWQPAWSPPTEALLAVAALRGATLAQATAGTLRGDWQRRVAADEAGPPLLLETLSAAAECGLGALVRELVAELDGGFRLAADLPTLTAAVHLLDRIAAGHVPGLPPPGEGVDDEPGAVPAFDAGATSPPVATLRADLLEAAVRHLEGLAGATRVEDAWALRGLLSLTGDAEGEVAGRLRHALALLAATGAPLMRGAAGAGRVLLHLETAAAFGGTLASVLDVEAADFRAGFWRGAFTVAGALLEADPDLLSALGDRVEGDGDAAFLGVLPSLREGFEALPPAARARLLAALNDRLGAGAVSERLTTDPAVLAATARADAAGHAAALALFGPLPEVPRAGTPGQAAPRTPPSSTNALSPADRWRLVLGQVKGGACGAGTRRLAATLEQLYGRGSGEGAGGDLVGAGDEASTPTVREWADDLGELFGERVREEVLGRAAVGGQAEAALSLDPESVTPSIELLEEVLSLKGGLSEAQLTHLRRLVDRVVEELVRALARRLRPALTGLGTPRPSRRKAGPLDLNRTVRANLRGARPGEEPPLVPERFIFRTRARRSMDWRIVLVVDVSGSMEASVIYSALVAAILSGLPAFKVDFLAFSTEVVDLTDRVDDPLGLLMEISVGGGTNIARALRAARERVTVPSRTLVLVVSDFEEGGGIGELLSQVRALVESGVRTLGLAALDDRGAPRYSVSIAEQLVAAGMPVAALSPLALAEWIGTQVRGT